MVNKVNENHADTSKRIDERKLLLLMAAKGITNYKDLCGRIGLSESALRVGFSQNEGYFGKRVYLPLCLLFGCKVEDLMAEEIHAIGKVVPETPEGPDTLLKILAELSAIRNILEVR